MLLTVAICTHDRSAMLARCLAALAAADRPTAAFEVLVIANCCSDDTMEVARAFSSQLPLGIVEEPIPGLSVARNRAVAEARGELMIWLDDDALARPGLLRAYQAAATASPEVAIFGGAILPMFQGVPPEWLVEGFAAVERIYAIHRPHEPVSFSGIGLDVPFGANFAIRTAVHRQFPFDITIGRQPHDAHAGGDEITMIQAAIAASHAGRWVPEAIVDHVITPDRQSEDWIWARCASYGRSRGRRAPGWWLRLRAAVHRRRYERARHRKTADQWLSLLVKAAISAGQYEARPAPKQPG